MIKNKINKMTKKQIYLGTLGEEKNLNQDLKEKKKIEERIKKI